MADTDISRLKINRDASPAASMPRRGRRIWFVFTLIAITIAGAVGYRVMTAPVQVEAVTVSMAYPSQSFTLLNATGYVVAQRKAAVASKATGRLEWLGVREGSEVRAGEIVARLENRDVTARMEQSAAN